MRHSKLAKNISLLMTLVLIFVLSLLGAGCRKTRPVFKDSSKLIKVEVEQEFDIVLKSNATTGYKWKLAKPLDKKILELVESEYKAPDDSVPGKGGEEVWTFRGVGKGKTLISLKYVRPWEKKKAPEKTEIFGVMVFKQ